MSDPIKVGSVEEVKRACAEVCDRKEEELPWPLNCVAQDIAERIRSLNIVWEQGALVKHMVERFLGWRLPENFNPDGGISFKRMFNEHTDHPMKHEPTGTNLFDAQQAEAMVRYMLDGLPAPPTVEGAAVKGE